MAEQHTIHVDIVSAEGEIFSGEAAMVFAPASEGDIGVAPRHAPLLSLLKHPLAAAGLSTAACRDAARTLERLALRGPRPPPGFTGLRRALAALDPQHALELLLEKTTVPNSEFLRQVRQTR